MSCPCLSAHAPRHLHSMAEVDRGVKVTAKSSTLLAQSVPKTCMFHFRALSFSFRGLTNLPFKGKAAPHEKKGGWAVGEIMAKSY